MADPLLIPARFNGPTESGNGGYSAGAVASHLEGPVEVTLRSPVPLDSPLDVVVEDGSASVLDGETVVAEAREAPDFELEVPGPVGLEAARDATRRYRGLEEGPFSRCFVCGRAREDAFGVFAGEVAERDGVVASPWSPAAFTADAEGKVRPEFVWAVLDCPTYFAAYPGDATTISFLARLTARIDVPVPAGEEHVVMAWPLGVDGRKREAGAAVLTAGGEVLARGRALMIEPRG